MPSQDVQQELSLQDSDMWGVCTIFATAIISKPSLSKVKTYEHPGCDVQLPAQACDSFWTHSLHPQCSPASAEKQENVCNITEDHEARWGLGGMR